VAAALHSIPTARRAGGAERDFSHDVRRRIKLWRCWPDQDVYSFFCRDIADYGKIFSIAHCHHDVASGIVAAGCACSITQGGGS
jgi:hypothetical protein